MLKKEQIIEKMEVLKKGVDAKKLADLFECSIGRINELKKQPVEGEVYYAKNVNTVALYEFAEKHNIDLSNVDFTKYVKVEKEKVEKSNVKVGDILADGSKIIVIKKIGASFVYLTDKGDLLSTKQLQF